MSKHSVSSVLPAPMHPERHARNGTVPSATAFLRLAHGFNSVAVEQKKMVFCRAQNFKAMSSGSSSAIIVWPHRFITGECTHALDLHLGVTVTDAVAASPPRFFYALKNTGGTTQNTAPSGEFYYYPSDVAIGTTIGPNGISHKRLIIEDVVSPNTEYYGQIELTDGMRLAYLMVNETIKAHADDTDTGACNPSPFVAQAPIYDAHAADLVDASLKLWRHNGAQLLSWACDYEEDASSNPSTSSTSYVNILTGSPTAYLACQYHGTLSRPDAIPVKFCVRAHRTAGAGTASFRLTDGTNNVDINAAAIGGSMSWFTGTGTITGTPANWQLEAKVSVGTTTVRIAGMSLFEYET